VQLLINHVGVPIARTRNGTMTLEEDDQGLLVRAQLSPEQSIVKVVALAVGRGDLEPVQHGIRLPRR
jgi:phage head maturation protease